MIDLEKSFPLIYSIAWNFNFIKRSVHSLQKTFRRTLVQWYRFIQTILKLQENGCFRNIDPLSDMISQKSTYLSTILPVFLLVLWVHIAQMKAFPHSNMAERYYSLILTHSEEPVAKFNIANLNKSAEEYLPIKKAYPDLNFKICTDCSLL